MCSRYEADEDDDDDLDIDVCLGCGRYYSTTPTLVEAWHKSFNYRENTPMDQLCLSCMQGKPPPHEF